MCDKNAQKIIDITQFLHRKSTVHVIDQVGDVGRVGFSKQNIININQDNSDRAGSMSNEQRIITMT